MIYRLDLFSFSTFCRSMYIEDGAGVPMNCTSRSTVPCFKTRRHLPGMQTQRNVPGSSRQLPSFWHGCDSHSLTLVSHRGPVKPWVQLQANEPGVLTQMPLCSHGEPAKWEGLRKIEVRIFNLVQKLRQWRSTYLDHTRRYPRNSRCPCSPSRRNT